MPLSEKMTKKRKVKISHVARWQKSKSSSTEPPACFWMSFSRLWSGESFSLAAKKLQEQQEVYWKQCRMQRTSCRIHSLTARLFSKSCDPSLSSSMARLKGWLCLQLLRHPVCSCTWAGRDCQLKKRASVNVSGNWFRAKEENILLFLIQGHGQRTKSWLRFVGPEKSSVKLGNWIQIIGSLLPLLICSMKREMSLGMLRASQLQRCGRRSAHLWWAAAG